MACTLHYATCVTLKIEKTLGEHSTIIKLMGRIRAEHLDELNHKSPEVSPRLSWNSEKCRSWMQRWSAS
jgi:hypothetical protein